MSFIKGDDIHRYRLYSKDGRKYARCLSVDDSGRQCCYEKRLDHIKAEIKSGKIHECSFNDYQRKNTLLSFFDKESKISSDDINEQIAKLVAKKIFL